MKIDPITIFMVGSILTLVIERIFYYKSRYQKKDDTTKLSNNPHPCAKHGERLAGLEKGQELIEERLDRIEDKVNGLKR